MKKIGIITYHCVDNYGAVLQAYALLETVGNLPNVDVEIVDYRPIELTRNYAFSIIPEKKSFVKLISNLISYRFKKAKNKKFKYFSNAYIRLSSGAVDEAWGEYDCLIVGSDQVWNPTITRLPPYYLDLPNIKAKKIAYAASIGKDELSQEELDFLGTAIQSVNTVSVREQSAISIINSVLPDNEVTQVLDPVFLKGASDWLKIVPKHPRFCNYILIYIMEPNDGLLEMARRLSAQKSKKIIIVSPNSNIKTILRSLCWPGQVLYTAGPLEFLELIVNADYVCTNSFHGVAFSIIFQKKFITVPHGSRNTRLESILGELGILSQQLSSDQLGEGCIDSLDDLFEYDVVRVNKRLDNLKQKSLAFLREALK